MYLVTFSLIILICSASSFTDREHTSGKLHIFKNWSKNLLVWVPCAYIITENQPLIKNEAETCRGSVLSFGATGDFTPRCLVSAREGAFGAPGTKRTVWTNFPRSSHYHSHHPCEGKARCYRFLVGKPVATDLMDKDSRWKQLGVIQAELLWFETKELLLGNHLSDCFRERFAVLPVPCIQKVPPHLWGFQTKKCWVP